MGDLGWHTNPQDVPLLNKGPPRSPLSCHPQSPQTEVLLCSLKITEKNWIAQIFFCILKYFTLCFGKSKQISSAIFSQEIFSARGGNEELTKYNVSTKNKEGYCIFVNTLYFQSIE